MENFKNKMQTSFSWQVFGGLFKSSLALITFYFITSTLDAEDFGFFSLSITLMMILRIAISLGMQQVGVRCLVKNNNKLVLKNIMFLQSITGLLIFAILFFTSNKAILNYEFRVAFQILALSLIIHPLQSSGYIFEARLLHKWTAITLIISSSVGFFLKLFVLYWVSDLLYLSLAFASEWMLLAFMTYIFAWKTTNFKFSRISVRKTYIKYMVLKSWPYFLGSIAVLLYTYTDLFLISIFWDLDVVAGYSIILKFHEAWMLIPTALTAIYLPSLIKAYAERYRSEKSFNLVFNLLLTQVVIASITWIAILYIFGETLLLALFSEEYWDYADLFITFSLIGLFYALGIASSKWYLVKDLQIFTLYRNVTGAVINVFLNLLLIPEWGTQGAAIGTLVSLIFANYLFDYYNKKTRELFYLKTDALLLRCYWSKK